MKLSNNTYDFLKWLGLTGCNSLAFFIGTVGAVLNFPYTAHAVAIVGAIGLLISNLIGISKREYEKAKNDLTGGE